MKLFFDTEFTGLHRDTTLISLGIVTEREEKFYAEFTDYNKSQCDSWIKEHVLKNTIMEKNIDMMILLNDPNISYVRGKKDIIRNNLLEWLKKFKEIQFISDVCHYDFVLLIDLLYGCALNIPSNVSACCHDINQDIAQYYKTFDKQAFDINRENLILELYNDGYEVPGVKHNSLYDAMVIKYIYEALV